MTDSPAAIQGAMEANWFSIDDKPKKPCTVVFYSANFQSVWGAGPRCGEVVPESELTPGLKFGIGYWNGKDWYYSGTNHFVFESGDDPEDWKYGPTHWAVLEPPKSTAGR